MMKTETIWKGNHQGAKLLTCTRCKGVRWTVALDIHEHPVMVCQSCGTTNKMQYVMPPLCDGCGENHVSALNKDNPAPSELLCQVCIDDAEEEMKMAGVL